MAVRIRTGFRNFVVSRPWGDELSEFVRFVTGDLNLPNAKSWEELEAYIRERNPKATADVFYAARHILKLYSEKMA